MKQKFRPEEITLKNAAVVVMTFLDAVTAVGGPQYPPVIFMAQRVNIRRFINTGPPVAYFEVAGASVLHMTQELKSSVK